VCAEPRRLTLPLQNYTRGVRGVGSGAGPRASLNCPIQRESSRPQVVSTVCDGFKAALDTVMGARAPGNLIGQLEHFWYGNTRRPGVWVPIH
jgi:hypothetical protein